MTRLISRRQFARTGFAGLTALPMTVAGQESDQAAIASRSRRTQVGIDGAAWTINGRPTYENRYWQGHRIEGLLMNSRMVQGVFDDANPVTVGRWAYPDTGRWDPRRNTREFLAAMPIWRTHGLLAFTINFQGGSPEGYSKSQPWQNSAFSSAGEPKPAYLDRMTQILDFADELGMVVILGLFYFGQDQILADETAVLCAVDNACTWLLENGWTNVVIEVNNECDVPAYDHDILKPERIHELIVRVKNHNHGSRRLLAGTSYGGGSLARENVVRCSDFILLHGNGVSEPARIAQMVRQVREVPGWRPMPVVLNEDDHFDFDKPINNMQAAISEYASWGFFDPGVSNYRDGYQCPPVNWQANTPLKQAFFDKVKEITVE